MILELEDPKLINKIRELLLKENSRFRKSLTEYKLTKLLIYLEEESGKVLQIKIVS